MRSIHGFSVDNAVLRYFCIGPCCMFAFERFVREWFRFSLFLQDGVLVKIVGARLLVEVKAFWEIQFRRHLHAVPFLFFGSGG